MADVAEANPRVLCAGGAGTGKTFLAERLARRWAEAGLQVALVCRSPWLKHHLASRLSMPGLTVSSIDGVRLDCRRAGLERFDALIVDEGQDLFEMGCIETLDGVLAGGLEAGRWCWFHDLNNQSLTPRFDRRAKDHLESLDPVANGTVRTPVEHQPDTGGRTAPERIWNRKVWNTLPNTRERISTGRRILTVSATSPPCILTMLRPWPV